MLLQSVKGMLSNNGPNCNQVPGISTISHPDFLASGGATIPEQLLMQGVVSCIARFLIESWLAEESSCNMKADAVSN